MLKTFRLLRRLAALAPDRIVELEAKVGELTSEIRALRATVEADHRRTAHWPTRLRAGVVVLVGLFLSALPIVPQ